MRKASHFILAVAVVITAITTANTQSDPLASWNDGPNKRAIVDFVTRVTKEGGPDFVPAPQRIATFDNDGTLWAEQPIYFQFVFALDRVKQMAPQHPEWEQEQPFKAVLANDMKALALSGEIGLWTMDQETGRYSEVHWAPSDLRLRQFRRRSANAPVDHNRSRPALRRPR